MQTGKNVSNNKTYSLKQLLSNKVTPSSYVSQLSPLKKGNFQSHLQQQQQYSSHMPSSNKNERLQIMGSPSPRKGLANQSDNKNPNGIQLHQVAVKTPKSNDLNKLYQNQSYNVVNGNINNNNNEDDDDMQSQEQMQGIETYQLNNPNAGHSLPKTNLNSLNGKGLINKSKNGDHNIISEVDLNSNPKKQQQSNNNGNHHQYSKISNLYGNSKQQPGDNTFRNENHKTNNKNNNSNLSQMSQVMQTNQQQQYFQQRNANNQKKEEQFQQTQHQKNNNKNKQENTLQIPINLNGNKNKLMRNSMNDMIQHAGIHDNNESDSDTYQNQFSLTPISGRKRKELNDGQSEDNDFAKQQSECNNHNRKNELVQGNSVTIKNGKQSKQQNSNTTNNTTQASSFKQTPLPTSSELQLAESRTTCEDVENNNNNNNSNNNNENLYKSTLINFQMSGLNSPQKDGQSPLNNTQNESKINYIQKFQSKVLNGNNDISIDSYGSAHAKAINSFIHQGQQQKQQKGNPLQSQQLKHILNNYYMTSTSNKSGGQQEQQNSLMNISNYMNKSSNINNLNNNNSKVHHQYNLIAPQNSSQTQRTQSSQPQQQNLVKQQQNQFAQNLFQTQKNINLNGHTNNNNEGNQSQPTSLLTSPVLKVPKSANQLRKSDLSLDRSLSNITGANNNNTNNNIPNTQQTLSTVRSFGSFNIFGGDNNNNKEELSNKERKELEQLRKEKKEQANLIKSLEKYIQDLIKEQQRQNRGIEQLTEEKQTIQDGLFELNDLVAPHLREHKVFALLRQNIQKYRFLNKKPEADLEKGPVFFQSPTC